MMVLSLGVYRTQWFADLSTSISLLLWFMLFKYVVYTASNSTRCFLTLDPRDHRSSSPTSVFPPSSQKTDGTRHQADQHVQKKGPIG